MPPDGNAPSSMLYQSIVLLLYYGGELVHHEGLEPSTNRLRAECSAIELVMQIGVGRGLLHPAVKHFLHSSRGLEIPLKATMPYPT